MEKSKELLVENDLFDAISVFHDCDDKNKRERYVKEYFEEFCINYNVNPDEALMLVERIINEKRKNGSPYEHYKNLKKIVFPNDKNKADNKRKKPEDDAR